MFQDKSRRSQGDADFLGKAVVAGRPYKVRAYWNTSRTGEQFLKLRLFALQTPPPRDPT